MYLVLCSYLRKHFLLGTRRHYRLYLRRVSLQILEKLQNTVLGLPITFFQTVDHEVEWALQSSNNPGQEFCKLTSICPRINVV